MKLDANDRKILSILQSNGRITNAQLAADVGISPPGMLERVKRLEKAGIIQRYVALVDAEKVGRGLLVLVSVKLAVHEFASIDKFREEINTLDEVLECYHISGQDDFMLKVAVKNIKDYEDFAIHKLTGIQGVNHINSSFIISTVKYQTQIPVDGLEEQAFD